MLTASAPAFKKDQTTDQKFIFVLQIHDGRFLIGQATNPCKRIAALNSGCHPNLRKALQVKHVLAVKPMTENRNLCSTVYRFCEEYGPDSVLAV